MCCWFHDIVLGLFGFTVLVLADISRPCHHLNLIIYLFFFVFKIIYKDFEFDNEDQMKVKLIKVEIREVLPCLSDDMLEKSIGSCTNDFHNISISISICIIISNYYNDHIRPDIAVDVFQLAFAMLTCC